MQKKSDLWPLHHFLSLREVSQFLNVAAALTQFTGLTNLERHFNMQSGTLFGLSQVDMGFTHFEWIIVHGFVVFCENNILNLV